MIDGLRSLFTFKDGCSMRVAELTRLTDEGKCLYVKPDVFDTFVAIEQECHAHLQDVSRLHSGMYVELLARLNGSLRLRQRWADACVSIQRDDDDNDEDSPLPDMIIMLMYDLVITKWLHRRHREFQALYMSKVLSSPEQKSKGPRTRLNGSGSSSRPNEAPLSASILSKLSAERAHQLLQVCRDIQADCLMALRPGELGALSRAYAASAGGSMVFTVPEKALRVQELAEHIERATKVPATVDQVLEKWAHAAAH